MSVDLATAGLTGASIGLRRRLPGRRDRRTLTTSDIQDLANRLLPNGKPKIADATTRRQLQAIDRSLHFSHEALLVFQDLLARLGIATARPIELPINDIPFWQRAPNPFANHQSTPQLPARADVVIIGAGLTGAAAAYHLKNSGKTVALLDQGDPAGEASGRNGGNFELLPENSVGIYEGLAPRPLHLYETALSSSAGGHTSRSKRTASIARAWPCLTQSRLTQRNYSDRANCLRFFT